MIIQPQILTTDPVVPQPGDGEFRVQFFDYDGTLLSTQYVDTGEDAIEPPDPGHPGLTRMGWNNSFTNIQEPINIGAQYTTTDGKTHAHIRLTTVSGLGATFYLAKDDSSTLTVDWGDTTSSDFTNTGNFNTGEHVYATNGDYVVKFWISSGVGSYELGNGASTSVFCGGSSTTKKSTLIRVHISSLASGVKNYAFYQADSLEYITIPPIVASLGLYCIGYTESLTALIVPSGVTLLDSYSCYGMYRAIVVVLPSSLLNVGTNVFQNAFGIRDLILPGALVSCGGNMCVALYCLILFAVPSTVTSIGATCFSNCLGIKEYIFYPTSPPTLGAGALTGINPICKIYVPDASVAAYKVATGWSTYADYIYPLSERP